MRCNQLSAFALKLFVKLVDVVRATADQVLGLRFDMVAALDRAIKRAGTPLSITVDHGTEFTSKAL